MIVWLTTVGLAYETDQLTHRQRPLTDASATADQIMDRLLADAVAQTNRRTRCTAPADEVHRTLARAIHRATSRGRWVWRRGVTRAPGFSTFSKALEISDADRHGFDDRSDVFGDLEVWHSLILSLAGPCSTFEVASVRLGSDKFDHFLAVGFDYWRHSRRGTDPRRAARLGVRTERSLFGLTTSKAFSWADLRANWSGYGFYRDLLGPDSVLALQDDGCVAQVEPWRWSDWVDAGWDEVFNPPRFTRVVERRVLAHLVDHRPEICHGRRGWDPDGLRDVVVAALAEVRPPGWWVRPPIGAIRSSSRPCAMSTVPPSRPTRWGPGGRSAPIAVGPASPDLAQPPSSADRSPGSQKSRGDSTTSAGSPAASSQSDQASS